MQVLLLLLFLVLTVGSIILCTFLVQKGKKKGGRTNKVGIIISLCAAAISLCLFAFVPFSLHVVNTGEIAVVKEWGRAKEVKNAGIHFDSWVSTTYEYYDLKTHEISEQMNAYSLDAQTMDSSLTVQFRIQDDKVIDINRQYGSIEVLSGRIKAMAIEKAKVVLSSQSAMDIINTRSTLSAKLEAEINNSIKAYYVDLTLVVITNIDFSDAFEKVVEDKMIAEQEKLKAQYEKEKAIIKAEEQLEVAKKEAEATIERAKGMAEAEIEAARGQAERIRLKSLETARMLGFTVTLDANGNETIDFEGKTADEIKVISEYLKYVEYLEKWDGKLPGVVTDGSGSIIIPKP